CSHETAGGCLRARSTAPPSSPTDRGGTSRASTCVPSARSRSIRTLPGRQI
ncbi:MAG: hypothetical protein AVDCRST_MAG77-5920, partial [uncultured Chloroflexi bacterium]